MTRVLPGLDRYRVLEPMFEAVRIVLTHRGDEYTPEYVQGVSGAAFRIGGICPCAPTCSCAMSPADLVSAMGYEVTRLSLEDVGAAPARLEELARMYDEETGHLPAASELADDELRALRSGLDRIVDAVKGEIDAGRAAVVWHAFTMAEDDVVAGYDDETGDFLGRGSWRGHDDDYARAPQLRMATSVLTGGWPTALLVGDRAREVDRQALEIAALREAVRHGRSRWNAESAPGDGWVMLEGLAAYDRWARDFESPAKGRDMGDAYCYGVYRSTHRMAGAFLREIAPRHPVMGIALLEAADCFDSEAAALAEAGGLLWWDSPEGPDAERNRRVAEILGRARDAYAGGIGALERALGAERDGS